MTTLQQLLDSDPYTAAELLADDTTWTALPSAERPVACLVFAVLAQSPHNTQPWEWRATSSAIELWADRSRTLTISDHDGRELAIGCGCALENLAIALAAHGIGHEIDLCPDPTQADLLARIRLGAAGTGEDPGLARLSGALAERRTDRSAYSGEPLPEYIQDNLRETAARFGTDLLFLDDQARDKVSDLIVTGDREQMADPAFRTELSSWMRPKDTRHRDGMPADLLGQHGPAAYIAPLVVRRFDLGKGQAAKDQDLVSNSPTIILFSTQSDDQSSWLSCGRTLARVTLQLHVDGFASAYMNQPCEIPHLRAELARVCAAPNPQLVLRVGKSTNHPSDSPRRPVSEVMLPAS